MTDLVLVISAPASTWDTPSKIIVNDNDPSTYHLGSAPGQSSFLYASVDASQLPTNSTLLGITAYIKKKAGGESSCRDVEVSFLNNAVLASSNYKNLVDWPSGGGAPYRTDTYGGASDMWGSTLTGNDFNSGNVWLRFKCEKYGGSLGTIFSVDWIGITVTYEAGVAIPVTAYGPAIQVI